ncbi:ABC transporter permease [Spiroplasma culicicola]|uniref:Uncharacterized protein n=1 Tax=Spiroplasma culicicola AES-1 TaxID=1276246 RepID=W6A686_9MOLU|nr:ABC transporter permease [Spiroplasma culicicola]AHI52507.1 hypothetical protein SCULI_v1c01660 [Spiroplasma culicicola AES-1]
MKYLFIKNTMVKSQMRSNLWLIVFFATIWLIYTSIILIVLNSANGGEKVAFRNYWIGEVANLGVYDIDSGGIANILGYTIVGAPTIVYGSIVSIFFIANGINKEIKTGQIYVWMTAQRTRTNIFYSKLFSIWASIVIILLPSILATLIFGATAKDANKYFILLIVDCLGIIIFTFMMSTVFSIIAIAFINANYWGNLINSLIISYMIVTEIVVTIFHNGLLSENWQWVEYITIQSLFVKSLIFSSVEIPSDISDWELGVYEFYGKFNIFGQSWGWQYISPIVNIGLICIISYGNNEIFKQKDLHI